jgi:predicted alpha/beta superfamily hydrolase/ASC-1-like (ASCH) protein
VIKNIFIALLILTASVSLSAQNSGEISTITFSSTVLEEQRQIQIYLPADYKGSGMKYAVLYVIDGQRYFLNGVAFQQNLTWQNVVPEFIVVGIVTNNQKRRTLFYDESPKFIQFLEEELIPKIDKDYRTLDERVFFGWEMAAGLGVEIFAKNPSLFNGYLLSSPTYMSIGRSINAGEVLKKDPTDDTFFYAMLGTVEGWSVPSMVSLDSVMNKTPNWTYKLSNEENHYTTPLTTINNGLRAYFSDYGPLRFYSIQEFNDFGGIASLKTYYKKRGERYHVSEEIHDDTKGYLLVQAINEGDFETFKLMYTVFNVNEFIAEYYSVARWVNRYFEFLLLNNDSENALALIELGLERHPIVALLNNAKGNYYASIGETSSAKKWINKAIEIAKENADPKLEAYQSNLKAISGTDK